MLDELWAKGGGGGRLNALPLPCRLQSDCPQARQRFPDCCARVPQRALLYLLTLYDALSTLWLVPGPWNIFWRDSFSYQRAKKGGKKSLKLEELFSCRPLLWYDCFFCLLIPTRSLSGSHGTAFVDFWYVAKHKVCLFAGAASSLRANAGKQMRRPPRPKQNAGLL